MAASKSRAFSGLTSLPLNCRPAKPEQPGVSTPGSRAAQQPGPAGQALAGKHAGSLTLATLLDVQPRSEAQAPPAWSKPARPSHNRSGKLRVACRVSRGAYRVLRVWRCVPGAARRETPGPLVACAMCRACPLPRVCAACPRVVSPVASHACRMSRLPRAGAACSASFRVSVGISICLVCRVRCCFRTCRVCRASRVTHVTWRIPRAACWMSCGTRVACRMSRVVCHVSCAMRGTCARTVRRVACRV